MADSLPGAASDTWSRHLDELFACRLCPAVAGEPVTGAVRGARILLVGQAPGPRELVERRPFAFTAGRRLFEWFSSIGAPEERFRAKVYIAAAIRCFPGRSPAGGDRVPSPDEIERCGRHLDREITLLKPSLVIGVGTLAISLFLQPMPLKSAVGRVFRGDRAGHDFDLVILPHPSGRSTWLNREENRALLRKSLDRIAAHPTWIETFRRETD